MEMFFEFQGNQYVRMPLLSFGDYDNSCDVERANARVIELANEWNPEKRKGVGELDSKVFLSKFPKDYTSYTSLDYSSSARRFVLSEKAKESIVEHCPDIASLNVLTETGSDTYYVKKDSDLYRELSERFREYPVLDDDVLRDVQSEMILSFWDMEDYSFGKFIDDEAKKLGIFKESDIPTADMLKSLDEDALRRFSNEVFWNDDGRSEYLFEAGGSVFLKYEEMFKDDEEKISHIREYLREEMERSVSRPDR